MTEDSAYFESKAFQDILKQYETSVKSEHPIYMDADDLADIADYYQYNGRLTEAEEAINLAFKYNPESVGVLLYKGREALSQKQYDTAYEYAEHILSIDYLEGIFFKGEILICQGEIEEADELYRSQLKEITPDELMDYVYDVAHIFSDYNLHDKAFEWISRSQGDNSDDFKELMAHTLFGLGKYKDSERIFNELIDHNPYSTRYWNALASAQFMNEDYNASITSSEYAIAINPDDPESILSKANGLYSLGNYETALTFFQKYSEKESDDEFGFLHQGTCLINMNRFEEAVHVLEKAEQIADAGSQYLPDIYQELAFAYSELKQPESALYYIDKTEHLDCDHINMEIVRGHILLSNDRPEESEESFKKALQLSDNAPRTMLRILVSLYDNHYVKSCYNLFKSYFEHIQDDWHEGYSYMALCCLDLKKQDEFIDYLKLAVTHNPREAKMVLGSYFPEGMPPEQYVSHIINKINQEET